MDVIPEEPPIKLITFPTKMQIKPTSHNSQHVHFAM